MAFRYTVDYNSIPACHRVHTEILDWCHANVGYPRITWSFSNWKWRFRFKRDYTMFLLRWS